MTLHDSPLDSPTRCAAIYALRPPDIEGSINVKEARFLHGLLVSRAPGRVAEIGTCSGLSTAVMGDALLMLNGADGGSRQVYSYDLMEQLYFDASRAVGFFVSLMPQPVQDAVTLRTGCTALNVGEDFAAGSLEFLMIDANHAHPWPCLDLLVCLPLLADDATVCLHDINLPLLQPSHAVHGAKLAFDALSLEKEFCEPTGGVRNMGAVRLAGRRDAVRAELLACIREHDWETRVDKKWLESASFLDALRDSWNAAERRLKTGLLQKILSRATRLFG